MAGPGFGTPALGAMVGMAVVTVGRGLGPRGNLFMETLRRCLDLRTVDFGW